jgi:hypothetical protein
MTDVPFSPSGAATRVTAQTVTNAQASIGLGPAGRSVRMVNTAATLVYAAAGDSTVDATNTDFGIPGSAVAVMSIGMAVTHISIKASTGSNSVVLVQPGFVGR